MTGWAEVWSSSFKHVGLCWTWSSNNVIYMIISYLDIILTDLISTDLTDVLLLFFFSNIMQYPL